MQNGIRTRRAIPFPFRGEGPAALTLVEVLVTLGLIAALAGVGLWVAPGLSHRQSEARARLELTALAGALEAFRRQWGDYPQTGGRPSLDDVREPLPLESAEVSLHAALNGRLDARLNPRAGPSFMPPGLVPTALLRAGSPPRLTGEDAYVDPWGRPYVYVYRASGSAPWKSESFLLYSRGPDGEDAPSVDGDYREDDPQNRDNIHVAH